MRPFAVGARNATKQKIRKHPIRVCLRSRIILAAFTSLLVFGQRQSTSLFLQTWRATKLQDLCTLGVQKQLFPFPTQTTDAIRNQA